MESMAEGMIKDLVASGHALADDMTGAPSVLVRCLAAQLEVQLVRANELAEDHQRAIESIKQADARVRGRIKSISRKRCGKCGERVPVNSCPCNGDSQCWVTKGWHETKLIV